LEIASGRGRHYALYERYKALATKTSAAKEAITAPTPHTALPLIVFKKPP